MESSIDNAKVLDISISPDSKAEVSYIYDKLYDVSMTYEKDGIIKHMEIPYGITKGTWISINNTDLFIMDKEAEIIQKLE